MLRILYHISFQIDKNVVLIMDDADMASFISSYGNVVFLKNLWKAETKQSNVEEEAHTPGRSEEADQRKTRGRSRTRSIEVEWIHTGNKDTKQVRAKQGRGTRKVVLDCSAGVTEILKEGKDIFFRTGQSSKGLETGFELWDFKQTSR